MEIIGHEKQRDFLKKIVKTGKISHAFLFSGPEKIGKKTSVIEWASLIFNEDFFARKEHPDLIFIHPQGKEIQISQIRNLSWRLSLKPYSAPYKMAIIDQAHLMNQEAQTALLKTLEEPRGNTILNLITEYPETLFPTIISRVQNLKFYPIEKEKIKKYLKEKGIPEAKAEKIAKLSFGRLGLAVDFLENGQKMEELDKKIKEIIRVSNLDLASRFNYVKDLSQQPEDLKEVLNTWLSYYREALLLTINEKENIKYYSFSEYLSDSKISNLGIEKLKNILREIQSTIFLISNTNINPRLALEKLMLEF